MFSLLFSKFQKGQGGNEAEKKKRRSPERKRNGAKFAQPQDAGALDWEGSASALPCSLTRTQPRRGDLAAGGGGGGAGGSLSSQGK